MRLLTINPLLLIWVAFFVLHFNGSYEILKESSRPLSLSAKYSQKNMASVQDIFDTQINSNSFNRNSENFSSLWICDFSGNRLLALDANGQIKWEQKMDSFPIPQASYNINIEYVTVAPDGNLIVSDGNGMMVQEIDRKTHNLVWQYGVRNKQGYADKLLHQPDKSFKFNDHEVVINDGNNRRVIVVNQKTSVIVWQYGENLQMGSGPGLLRGNTSVVPLDEGRQFLITDTLEKKIMIVDRATKKIIWQWKKPDAKWLQHVFPTKEGTFVLEDRQKNEVFEINREGKILWTLTKLADGTYLKYPTDTAKLKNGNVLIAEAGRRRVIEVEPTTEKIVRQFKSVGFVTTIAIDNREL